MHDLCRHYWITGQKKSYHGKVTYFKQKIKKIKFCDKGKSGSNEVEKKKVVNK